MQNLRRRLQKVAVQWLDLPSDVVSGESRLTCIGGTHVTIENMRFLLHVSEQRIEVDLGAVIVAVIGDGFTISLITDREVHVQGEVRQITYRENDGTSR